MVTYGICALLTLPGIHKRETPCQFMTPYLSAPSEVKVLWSKQQQRKNGPIFSCISFWFCFLIFSMWWGKPASSACFQFQGRRLQPNVQQGKIWRRFQKLPGNVLVCLFTTWVCCNVSRNHTFLMKKSLM